ncbi:RNA-binding protein [Paraglaciecola aquimarina]|uniref:RNA-binding protein n=1 Tax=Paraglaciecola algarum TaxID=3050085 RepID=A0ABS9DD95_9ALTE|nr:RNA-binding protein [Paraglaciecola sp. G1-23]MCF2950325.1 RNA-binding protein [Paraglaciecola sp. G1-23]
MKSSFILNIIVTAILAVLVFVLVPLIATDISNHLTAVAGVVIGGLLAPTLLQVFESNSSSSESDDQELSTLYVGNLPYRANEQAVQEHFEQQGTVNSVRLMKDRRTGKRKGYGFVEMDTKGANKAIKNLNDSSFQERTLKVRLAKEKVTDE